jgi:hypothetical protein
MYLETRNLKKFCVRVHAIGTKIRSTKNDHLRHYFPIMPCCLRSPSFQDPDIAMQNPDYAPRPAIWKLKDKIQIPNSETAVSVYAPALTLHLRTGCLRLPAGPTSVAEAAAAKAEGSKAAQPLRASTAALFGKCVRRETGHGVDSKGRRLLCLPSCGDRSVRRCRRIRRAVELDTLTRRRMESEGFCRGLSSSCRGLSSSCQAILSSSCRVACQVPVEFPVELSRPGLK